ncbi:MAG: citrate synthase [Planctomycetes bacterium]|nr:citrate synthase [Planctomycetota bacterium]
MADIAKLEVEGKTYELPVITGSENEKGIDISKLRQQSGHITLDDAYMNTGSCKSAITYIDGDKGILRYRGYPIEELADKYTFIEIAQLVIWGELPTAKEKEAFSDLLTNNARLHPSLVNMFDGFPHDAHPMAMLSAMMNAMSCYHHHLYDLTCPDNFMEAAARIISKVRTIAATPYRIMNGLPINQPHPRLDYCSNFLHMMFSMPYEDYVAHPDVVKALNLFLVLHADHEQNCSTSTVRMVASSKANLFASVSAGICALWGPLHGGANVEVIKMLEEIHQTGKDPSVFVENAKKKDSKQRLMGFGHRVYKNFDPRSKILKTYVDRVLKHLNRKDPLLDIARHLEEAALKDPYFVERKLYPNVDFYSGILLRAIGIPTDMFTVMFAIGRMPGYIANWKEINSNPEQKIYRPRQIYTGPNMRSPAQFGS